MQEHCINREHASDLERAPEVLKALVALTDIAAQQIAALLVPGDDARYFDIHTLLYQYVIAHTQIEVLTLGKNQFYFLPLRSLLPDIRSACRQATFRPV